MIRFSVTILISAFLLFQVQPLIARYILPWFGGTPAVWNTCMLFFQVLLLIGYGYSHVMTSRISPKVQVVIHVVLLLAAICFLPIIPDESLKPQGDESPTTQILLLLAITIGLPYVLLSTTGPLVQAWFAKSFPGRSPYRLFALSNFGSLVALVSYPFVFEPRLRLNDQANLWSVGFLVFVFCCCWCAYSTVYLFRAGRDDADKVDSENKNSKQVSKNEQLINSPDQINQVLEDKKPGPLDMLLWILLSAVPSVLLLASTSQLCQEVAVVAFLWVLPLSLYLISFIICFDNPFWYQRVFFGVVLIVSLVAAILSLFEGMAMNLILQVVAFSTALFAACMTCHGELAASKPAPGHLTLFYLMVSVGGALGGMFVVIVAPRIFVDYWELHFGYLAALALTGIGFARNGKWGSLKLVLQISAVLGLLFFGGMYCYSPETLFEKENFGYRAMLAASAALTVFFGLFGFGWSPSMFEKKDTLDEKSPEESSGEIGAVIYFTMCTCIGVLFASVATRLLLFHPQELQERIDSPAKVLLISGVVALLVVAMQVAFRWFLSKLFSTTGARWAHHAVYFAAAMLLFTGFAGVLWREAFSDEEETIARQRDFYGILKVKELPKNEEKGKYPSYRKLYNGRTLHGQQYVDKERRNKPTGYYLPGSGVGLAISEHPSRKDGNKPMKIGVVGLGIGTLAAYGREGDTIRFYEINPQVEEVARKYFYYLDDSSADMQIAIGDARIEMERELKEEGSQQFDVLAIDAFSSDAIPRHLLTAECVEIYREHLKEDGILAIHISNRHLELEPIVYTLARRQGLIPGYFDHRPRRNTVMSNSSTWVLLGDNEQFWSNKTVLRNRENSEFVMDRFKSLPLIEEKIGSDVELGRPYLDKDDSNKELTIEISGSKATGRLLIPGQYNDGDPDAFLEIDGESIELYSNLDDKYYWTDDFGSLWDVTK